MSNADPSTIAQALVQYCAVQAALDIALRKENETQRELKTLWHRVALKLTTQADLYKTVIRAQVNLVPGSESGGPADV